MAVSDYRCDRCDLSVRADGQSPIRCASPHAASVTGCELKPVAIADPTLVRGATHGDFATSSTAVQSLRLMWRSAPMWDAMTDAQKQALDEIALKQVRILYGDPKFKDHWDDIAGYGKLGGQNCV